MVMYRRGIIQAFPERHWDVGFDWNRYENFMNAVDAELKKRGYDLENCCFNNAEENDAIEQSIRNYQNERLRQYGHNIKENKKTRMKKQTIRLNESQFNKLVKRTVKRVLKENSEMNLQSQADMLSKRLNNIFLNDFGNGDWDIDLQHIFNNPQKEREAYDLLGEIGVFLEDIANGGDRFQYLMNYKQGAV